MLYSLAETRQAPPTANNTPKSQTPKTPQMEQAPTPNLDALKAKTVENTMLMPKRFRRAYEIGQEAVSKSAERRRIQGRAAAILADEIGVTFDPKLQKALLDGQEKAINRAREQLKTTGIYNLTAEQTFDKFVNRKTLGNSEEEIGNREEGLSGAEVSNPYSLPTVSPPNKAPAKAVQAAVAPVSEDKSERERQGRAIKVVARANEVELPAAVIKPLEDGAAKAIERSQEILRDNGALPPIEGIKGRDADVLTDSGKSNIKTQYRVVEADDLIDSDSANYPQELQPRDRNRKAMQQQVAQIANNPRAELLMESTNPNQGAPTVRNDGVVLNGNGRTMGLKGAYAQNTAGDYRQAIIDNAERLGLDADEVSKMNKPVLVRIADNLSDEQVNEVITDTTGGSRMGAGEQAGIDADRITSEALSRYVPNDYGDYTTPANRDFVGGILSKIAGENDINAYTDKDGNTNADGINRVKRAVFAKAYGDEDLISKMAESTDDNVRNVSSALMNAAPKMAEIQVGADKGNLHSYNLAKDVIDAVKKLSALRDEGTSVSEYLKKQSMFDEYQDTDEMRDILEFLDRNKRSSKRIAQFLNKAADMVKRQGDPKQEQLFDSEPLSEREIIKRAIETVEDNGEQDLFSAANLGNSEEEIGNRKEGKGQRAESEEVALPEGYKTESGRPLSECEAKEFIVDEKGNRDFGEITAEIEKATDGIVKAAPIRLQVGNEKGGYIHIVQKHLPEIQGKGFDNAVDYIKHILKNFNQIYDARATNPNRFILYCKDAKERNSKGYLPMDLEFERSGDYYKIVTAHPRRERSIKEELVYDGSPTHPTTAAVNSARLEEPNNKDGVEPQRDIAKTNSPADSVTQEKEKGKREDKRDYKKRPPSFTIKNRYDDEEVGKKRKQLQDFYYPIAYVDKYPVLKRKVDEIITNALMAYDKNTREYTRKHLKDLVNHKEKEFAAGAIRHLLEYNEKEYNGHFVYLNQWYLGEYSSIISERKETTEKKLNSLAKQVLDEKISPEEGYKQAKEFVTQQLEKVKEEDKEYRAAYQAWGNACQDYLVGKLTAEQAKEKINRIYAEMKDTELKEYEKIKKKKDNYIGWIEGLEAKIETNIAKGREAVKRVIDTHEDVKSAMHREDIGDIDFVYGTPGKGKNFKKGYGLSHIVAKRDAENGKGLETAYKLVEVIERGTETDRQGAKGSNEYRLRIHYDGYTAVLSSSTGKRNAWLLTGWEEDSKIKSTSRANGEGNDSTAATAAKPTLTRQGGETNAPADSVAQSEENGKGEKWNDERINKAVAGDESLANSAKAFGGTVKNGKVTFKSAEGRENFIKHLENLQNPDFKLSIAYHGSPHDFESFSTGAIGTGEGGQAHGWGLYFAGNRAVSEGYRKALSQRGKGKLFKVDIPDADVMLDEQKNFANQSPKVQKMIETALNGLTAQQKEKFFEKHIKLISRPKRSQAFQEAQEALQTLINAQNAVKNYHKSAFKGLPIRTMSKVLTNEEVEQVKASVENAENIADSLNGKIEEAQNRLEEEEKRESEEFERKQFEYEEQISRYKKDTFALFKEKPLSGKEVYDGLETAFNGSSELASRYLNKNGIQGITYDGDRDGRCYVVFDDKAIKILEKWSRQGQGKATVENFVDPKDLTDQQRGIAEIGEELGVPVVFFKGDPQLNGAHANGITYLNVNSPINPRWIFWHESGHWLKAQHPDLISEIIDKLDITKAQIEDFRERTKRYDLTDEEVREEIFSDNMFDADKRLDILQKLGKKDDSLLDRLVSWLKSVMDRVTSYFNTPKYGLTNSQKNQMFAELGKALRQIKDSEGKPRYRYGNTTRVVQYADGRELPVYSFAGEKALTANQKDLARAKRMEKEGKPRREIFYKTGWVKGKDNKWRFEIPDNLDKIDFKYISKEGSSARLVDIYHNSELYMAYPFLMNVTVKNENLGNDTLGTTSTANLSTFFEFLTNKITGKDKNSKYVAKIKLNVAKLENLDPDEAGRTLVHEIQHVIQEYEDFARGGNPERVKEQLKNNLSKIVKESEKISGGESYLNYLLGLAKGQKRNKYYDENILPKMKEKDREQIEKLSEKFAKLREGWLSNESNVDLYERLGGEQEARENQERATDYTNMVRHYGEDDENLPALDVPTIHGEDALIVFGGKSYSMAREKVTETKKATVKVTGDEFGEYSGIEELRDKAIQYYRNNLQGTSVTNKELGKIDIDKNGLIDFTTSGRKKLQSSSRERKKLLLIKHLPELLKSATNVRSVKANKEKHNHEGFYYMNNDVEINGQNMPVHITLIKRNNGDVQFYNYNFVEQTENTPVKPARPESPEGALGTLPVGVSSEDSVNQNQEKVKGEIKYSIGNSEEQTRGWFSNLFESFAKKAHLRGDRIITAEDMAARQREQQNKAIDKYIADPSKENLKAARDLGVSNGMINARKNGEEYLTELGVNDSIRRSPARIAEKVPLFRAFWGMADRAMKKLVLGRDQYSKKLNAAFDGLNSEEMKTLNDLLFAGDAEQVDYSELTKEERAELGENAGHKEYDKARIAKIVREHEGVNEKVAGAFVKIRQLITKMANEIDKARQTTRNPSKWLTSDEIEALKNNKFVLEIRKIGDHETRNGKRLVSWKEYAHFEPKDAYTIDEATLDRFERDDTIQVLSKRKLSDGMYEVKTREQLGRINRIQGYIPHLFHDFMIRVVKDGKVVESYGFGGVIGSGRTQRDAVKMAEEWKKEHQLAEGEEIYIAPKMANFGKEFEDAYAPIMGDKDYDTMVHKIAKNNGIKLKDAKAMVDGSVKLRNRHRFLGSLLKRQGAKGYVQDMQYVLRHYFNSGSRYVALETEFKPQAISLFERVFGAFGDDWSGHSLAKYTKDFINDINGNPTHIETILNKAINSSPVFRNFLVPIFGERAALTLTTNLSSLTAVAKLGVFNPSSALLNYTQLVNAGGYLGGYGRLLKHAARLVGHKLTQSELRILTEAGTLQDIGLDTSTGYDKNRGYGNLLMQLGNKTMYFFKQADTHCRVATTLAAFEKAISEGKTRQEAIEYAKGINRKANFSYGVEDAPNMFRRTGPVGKVVLQFQKYPIKQLEIWGDMLSNKTTRAQKAAFWIPYFFMVGLMGFIPVGDWLDDLVKKLSGYSPKDLVQDTAIKWAGKDADKQMIAKVAMYGAGATLNIDTSKRAGLSDIMPDDFTDFMLGAIGSTVWNTSTNLAGGDYANALRSVSPGAYNIYAAIEGESRGKRGRVNTVYEDMWDRIVRGLGFRSVDESLDADTKRILNNEQKRYTKERQSVIDALVADPYDEEARKRAKELGITGKQVKEERKKKSMTNRQRIEENMSKRQKKEYQYLADFAG